MGQASDPDGPAKESSFEDLTDVAHFLDSLSLPPPPPVLRAPSPRPLRGRTRSALAKPSRRSVQQATLKTIVPMA
jgi:hypothetical protein